MSDATSKPGEPGEPELARPPDPAAAAVYEANRAADATGTGGTEAPPVSPAEELASLKEELAKAKQFEEAQAERIRDCNAGQREAERQRDQLQEELATAQDALATAQQANRELSRESNRRLEQVTRDLAEATKAVGQARAAVVKLEGELQHVKTELEEERAKPGASLTREEIERLLGLSESDKAAAATTTTNGGEPMADPQKVPPHRVAMIKNRLYPQLAPDSHLKYADDVLAGMPETAIDDHIVELQQEIAKRDEIAKLAKRAFKMQGQLNDPKKAHGLDDLKGDSKEDLEEYIEQLEEAIDAKEKAEAARAQATREETRAEVATTPPAGAEARTEGKAAVAPSFSRRYWREGAALLLLLLMISGLVYWDWTRKAKTVQTQTPVAGTPVEGGDASQPSYEEWLETYRDDRKELKDEYSE